MPENIKKAGKASYVERNRIMIDESDFGIFYMNENYFLSKSKSGTKIAYDYALKKSKKGLIRIFNVFLDC